MMPLPDPQRPDQIVAHRLVDNVFFVTTRAGQTFFYNRARCVWEEFIERKIRTTPTLKVQNTTTTKTTAQKAKAKGRWRR